MHKSDAEKMESIIDKHDRIYRRQVRVFKNLGFLSIITAVLSVITALFSTSLLLKYTLCVVICVCLIYLVFMFFCLDRYIALSRQTLLWLMRREATAIMTGVAAGLHVFALLAPSVWLFYQWQWNGLFLLQWQGAVFLLCLFALPVSTFCFY
ncbi:hypothetical protein J5L86_004353 [Salmonella enterica]|nr:hypothetical protein [Salmonella enterica subsp. salamae]EHI7819785.1 hypothetical protein [Salmonella enterica]EHJ0757210.1 hypothetical protein [Salmonella enterica]